MVRAPASPPSAFLLLLPAAALLLPSLNAASAALERSSLRNPPSPLGSPAASCGSVKAEVEAPESQADMEAGRSMTPPPRRGSEGR
eukprot:scaffold86126_cov32-Tisochrysis_lutea.AAC.5